MMQSQRLFHNIVDNTVHLVVYELVIMHVPKEKVPFQIIKVIHIHTRQ